MQNPPMPEFSLRPSRGFPVRLERRLSMTNPTRSVQQIIQ
uniref:Bm1178, isoform b n=1 Tax=Brugia malayi TaxID=6279 RepID=A0A1I9G6E1_BRUMA|nr:Bm1178, isoform b [Brugia malayi]